MNEMEIKRIAVLGGGIMGAGIAQACAQAGYDVTIKEVSNELGQKALGGVRSILERRLQRKSIDQAFVEATMSRLSATDDMARAVGDADIVFEAVPEELKLKQQVLVETERLAPRDVIFCSNTSAISIAEIASVAERKANVIGTHFFQPVPVQKLVEVSKTKANSTEVVDRVIGMLRNLDKESIVVNDVPGFVSIRAGAYVNEGIRLLEEGVADAPAIDKIYKGLGHAVGPLQVCDFAGLDTMLHIRDYLYPRYKRPELRAPALLRQKVEKGELGRKSGRGFHDYGEQAAPAPSPGRGRPSALRAAAVLTPRPDPDLARLLKAAGYTVRVCNRKNASDLRSAVTGADIVFEGLSDNVAERKRLLAQVERTCKPEAILAVLTSITKVGDLTSECTRKERVIGVNFLGLVPDGRVVEVIVTGATSKRVQEETCALLHSLYKDTALVKDVPGFVSRRLDLATFREAILLIEDKVADPKDIDRIVVLSLAGELMGPLSQVDMEGLDIVLEDLDYLYKEYKRPEFEAPSLLREMVSQGKLGRKTGKGFFDYVFFKVEDKGSSL